MGKRICVLAKPISVVLAVWLVLRSMPAMAAPKCGDAKTFFNWGCGSSGGSDELVQTLLTIYNWLAAAVSVAVIIGIVYGGILYASAAGNEAQAKKGIEAVRNAVIALLLFFIMYAFLNYITPGGLFN